MLYFAYGSNLDLLQMQSRCPGSTPVGSAYFPNRMNCDYIKPPADAYFEGIKRGYFDFDLDETYLWSASLEAKRIHALHMDDHLRRRLSGE